jgi:hypothetical protein
MKLLLILLMVVSQPVWAEWVKYAETTVDDGTVRTSFWDPDTLRKTPNGRRVWVMTTYDSKVTRSGVPPYQSMRSLREYDCNEERARDLQQTVYSGAWMTGETVSDTSEPFPWRFVVPNSIGASGLALICKAPLPK